MIPTSRPTYELRPMFLSRSAPMLCARTLTGHFFGIKFQTAEIKVHRDSKYKLGVLFFTVPSFSHYFF
jgi:hypothetical protein